VIVIGAGDGWQRIVPGAAVKLTVASVDGLEATLSVTLPSSGAPLATMPEVGLLRVSVLTAEGFNVSVIDAPTLPEFWTAKGTGMPR